jgi:hypothetical protein
MKIKNCLRAGERKSIARFRQHFGGPRLMAALAYRALSLMCRLRCWPFLAGYCALCR